MMTLDERIRQMKTTESRNASTRRTRRVLVVEDERDLNELISFNLQRHGYEVLSAFAGDEAVAKARQNVGHAIKIEVECDTLEQVEEAVKARADILLLDNMTPETLKTAVELVAGRALCEASGGITLETVRSMAQSGVDILSVGALTHGAKSVDIGLDIEIQTKKV